jgi:hypothetical protein
VVKVTREEVVQKMVEIAEAFNLQAIQGAGLPETQIEEMVAQVRPQLYTIQGEIYDTLVEDGVIQ